jgi:hypothetical protein
MRRAPTARKHTSLGLTLLSAIAGVGCEGLTLTPPEPRPAAVQAAPGPPIVGARLLRDGDALLLAHGDAIWRVALPLGSSPPVRHATPGPVGELALVAGELVAAIASPGLLVYLARDGLGELARTAVAEGATGLAASADGRLVLVASTSGKLTAVRARQVAWSRAVPEPARSVALAPDGHSAFVAHAAGVTRVDALDADARAEPFAVRGAEALEPLFAQHAGELFLGHAVAGAAAPASARVDRVLGAEAGAAGGWEAGNTAPLRAITATKERLILATDAEIIALERPLGGALAPAGSRPTSAGGEACRDPRGVALSAEGGTAYVACADGAITAVPLAGGETERLALVAAAPSPCSSGEAPPSAHEHMARFGGVEEIHGWIRRYHCAHPDVTELVEIGKSNLGRPIYALYIGKPPRSGKPTLLLNGAHHGSELMSPTFVLDAIDALLADKSHRRLERLVFAMVPLVNPDGNFARLEAGLMGRKNGRDNDGDGKLGGADGVDLNRNYPFQWSYLGESEQSSSQIYSRYYRGPGPGSEPETRAMMRLAEQERFAASISFHTGTLAVLAPYTMPHLRDPEPNEALVVAEEVAKHIKNHPEGGVPVRRNLYPVDGTDQDWLRNRFGTLALLVEAVKTWQVDIAGRAKIVNSIRPSWMALADRYLDGPSLGGRVLDAVGRPLEAEVDVVEIARPEKERWTSRCSDGRFDRYLARAGSYTLRVALPDGTTVERKLEVGAGHVELDVVLPVLVVEAARCPTIASETRTPARTIPLSRSTDAQ